MQTTLGLLRSRQPADVLHTTAPQSAFTARHHRLHCNSPPISREYRERFYLLMFCSSSSCVQPQTFLSMLIFAAKLWLESCQLYVGNCTVIMNRLTLVLFMTDAAWLLWQYYYKTIKAIKSFEVRDFLDYETDMSVSVSLKSCMIWVESVERPFTCQTVCPKVKCMKAAI